MFGCVDNVPPSLPIRPGFGKLFALEDNDAVIKMTVKQRSPMMRHVSRTHRVGLDWLFGRISKDPGVFIKYVPTKEQIADILTKGSFTADAWSSLCKLCVICPMSSYKHKPETATKNGGTALLKTLVLYHRISCLQPNSFEISCGLCG